MRLTESFAEWIGFLRGPESWRAWLVLFIAYLGGGAPTVAAHVVHEFEVKAVFLLNFARFVEWPPDAFSDQADPLVIGVLGADPFGRYLDSVSQRENVRGRPLVVRRYRNVAEIGVCHILFISGSEGAAAGPILKALAERPVLSVCDTQLIARQGVIVQLVMDREHVRLRINLEAAKRARLSISAKLLRSAEIVGENAAPR